MTQVQIFDPINQKEELTFSVHGTSLRVLGQVWKEETYILLSGAYAFSPLFSLSLTTCAHKMRDP